MGELEECYWHLLGKDQGCSLTFYNAQDSSPTIKSYVAQNVNSLLLRNSGRSVALRMKLTPNINLFSPPFLQPKLVSLKFVKSSFHCYSQFPFIFKPLHICPPSTHLNYIRLFSGDRTFLGVTSMSTFILSLKGPKKELMSCY